MIAGETPVHSMTKRESEVSFLFSYKKRVFASCNFQLKIQGFFKFTEAYNKM